MTVSREVLDAALKAHREAPLKRDAGRSAMEAALCAAFEASQPVGNPVAHVPVHPRNGPLWSDTFPAGSELHRSNSYPMMPLYTAQAVDLAKIGRLVNGAIGYLQIGLNSQCMNKLREMEDLVYDRALGVNETVTLPAQAVNQQPLNLQLADALDCFWNPACEAVQQASYHGPASGSDVVGAIAQGLAAVAARLREHAGGEVKP